VLRLEWRHPQVDTIAPGSGTPGTDTDRKITQPPERSTVFVDALPEPARCPEPAKEVCLTTRNVLDAASDGRMTGAESLQGPRLAAAFLIVSTCVRPRRPSATSSRVHDLEHLEQRSHASARSSARGRCQRCPTQGRPPRHAGLAVGKRRHRANSARGTRPPVLITAHARDAVCSGVRQLACMTNSSAVGINLAAVHRRLATLSRNSAVKVGPLRLSGSRLAAASPSCLP
jgi:hypothetical protein